MLEQMVDDPDVRDSDDLFMNTNMTPATPVSPLSPSNVVIVGGLCVCGMSSLTVPYCSSGAAGAPRILRMEFRI